MPEKNSQKVEVSSLVIVSYLTLKEHNLSKENTFQVYDRFRLVIIRRKSKFKKAHVKAVLEKEVSMSDRVDVLFWVDLTEKDLLDLYQVSKDFSDKVHCHYVSDDFSLPKKMKLPFD